MQCTDLLNCLKCSPGYYQEIYNQPCIKCLDPYCYACDIGGECLQDGCYSFAYYNISTISCYLCSSQVPHCNACNYTYVNSTTSYFTCTGCGSGYALSTNLSNVCYPCPQNCLECMGNTFCSNCTAGSYINRVNSTEQLCEPCAVGC